MCLFLFFIALLGQASAQFPGLATTADGGVLFLATDLRPTGSNLNNAWRVLVRDGTGFRALPGTEQPGFVISNLTASDSGQTLLFQRTAICSDEDGEDCRRRPAETVLWREGFEPVIISNSAQMSSNGRYVLDWDAGAGRQPRGTVHDLDTGEFWTLPPDANVSTSFAITNDGWVMSSEDDKSILRRGAETRPALGRWINSAGTFTVFEEFERILVPGGLIPRFDVICRWYSLDLRNNTQRQIGSSCGIPDAFTDNWFHVSGSESLFSLSGGSEQRIPANAAFVLSADETQTYYLQSFNGSLLSKRIASSQAETILTPLPYLYPVSYFIRPEGQFRPFAVPGSVMSLRGVNLGAANLSVLIDDAELAVLQTEPFSIYSIVPFDITPGLHKLQLVSSVPSPLEQAPMSVNVLPFQPYQPWKVPPNNQVPNAGGPIDIYVAGLGAINASGNAAHEVQARVCDTSPLQFGCYDSPVLSSAVVPGIAGLYNVRVKLPDRDKLGWPRLPVANIRIELLPAGPLGTYFEERFIRLDQPPAQ